MNFKVVNHCGQHRIVIGDGMRSFNDNIDLRSVQDLIDLRDAINAYLTRETTDDFTLELAAHNIGSIPVTVVAYEGKSVKYFYDSNDALLYKQWLEQQSPEELRKALATRYDRPMDIVLACQRILVGDRRLFICKSYDAYAMRERGISESIEDAYAQLKTTISNLLDEQTLRPIPALEI